MSVIDALPYLIAIVSYLLAKQFCKPLIATDQRLLANTESFYSSVAIVGLR